MPRRLSQPKIAALAREYLAERSKRDAAEERMGEIKVQLLAQLAIRDVHELLAAGVRILRKASGRTHYSPATVRARLGARAEEFIIEAVDTSKLKEAQKAGRITAEDLATCASAVTTGKPYVDVVDLQAA